MNINLTAEQQRVIKFAIESGAYDDAREVLDQAFEILREQLEFQGWMASERDRVSAQIETGFQQAKRGESIDGDVAIETLRSRRAERLTRRG